MTVARCDDPNCTCRSPDLQWFTNQVLRRDAAKTDYVIIPLVGGVLARCLIAEDIVEPRDPEESGDNSLLAQAHAVVDLATQADNGGTWEDDTHAYGIIADLVFCNWPGVMSWGSVSYRQTTLGLNFGPQSAADTAAGLRFLNSRPPPSWTESVLITLLATSYTTDRGGVPFLGKGARVFRVALADRLRREGLVTWPRVLSAAVNDWTAPTLERLARHLANAGDAAIHFILDQRDRDEAAAAAGPGVIPGDAERPADDAAGTATTGSDDGESAAAEQLVQEAVAEIDHWRLQRDRVQRERDLFAGRDARSRSRAESLERERDEARRASERLERDLRTTREERDRLAERLAATEAIAEGAVSAAPPADLLAGRRVLLFTGVDNADARTALAKGFWDLGAAQVDCYWTDKARGPDAFPAEAIIVADVTFMGHSDWDLIQDRVRSSGAWWYWGKHGAATLSRAVAAAWSKHLERS